MKPISVPLVWLWAICGSLALFQRYLLTESLPVSVYFTLAMVKGSSKEV